MTWNGIVLDTCLLVEFEAVSGEQYFLRLEIIAKIHTAIKSGRLKLLLDTDSFIAHEYQHIPPHGMARKFLTEAFKNGGVHYASGSLTRSAEKALSDNGVDNDDYPLIAVAQTVAGYYVTTEKKHLAIAQRKLIARHCGVVVAEFEELPGLLAL